MGGTPTSNTELKGLILNLTEKVNKFENGNKEVWKVANENKKEIREIKTDNIETKKKFNSDILGMKKDIDMLKADLRVKNLIFYNVINSDNENNRDLFFKIADLFTKVGIDNRLIENVKRIGPRTGHRPVVVTLMSQRFKKDIFDRAEILRKKFNITIANDLTKTEREEFNKLKAVRNELKDNNIEARFANNKLLIEGKIYDLQEARKILIDIKSKTTVVNKKVYEKSQNYINQGKVDISKKRAASSSPGQINNLEKKKKRERWIVKLRHRVIYMERAISERNGPEK